MNAFSIVLVVCLATGASAFFGTKGPNFDGLNDILAERQVINAIREKLSSLNGATREAAEIAIKIVDSAGCDHNILSALAKVKKSSFEPFGNKKIELFLKPYLNKIADSCGFDYEQDVASKVDVQLGRQINAVEGFDTTYLRTFWQARQYPQYFPGTIVHNLVRKLAKADPNNKLQKEINKKTGERDEKIHRANTARAFDQYIIKPCKAYTSAHKDLFETIEGFAYFADINKFYKQRSYDFKTKSLAYVVCRAMLEESSDYKKAALDYNVLVL